MTARRPVPTVAIVLAGGAGERFAGSHHKLAADLDGRPLLDHAIGAAVGSGIGPVVLVTGALPEPALPLGSERVVVVHNERWADGQITSLRAGLDAAAGMHGTAAVIGLGDQPFVRPSAWQALAASDAAIAVATYGGRRGHPVRLHRDVWLLLPAGGDEGARSLMRRRPELVEEVPCEGSPIDIDTVEDLRRWQSSS